MNNSILNNVLTLSSYFEQHKNNDSLHESFLSFVSDLNTGEVENILMTNDFNSLTSGLATLEKEEKMYFFYTYSTLKNLNVDFLFYFVKNKVSFIFRDKVPNKEPYYLSNKCKYSVPIAFSTNYILPHIGRIEKIYGILNGVLNCSANNVSTSADVLFRTISSCSVVTDGLIDMKFYKLAIENRR